MALKTRLTEMLNIKHPIMLAGMGGVSYAEVCAAMCNAGGYGVLGMAGTTPDFIAGQMKRVRELTDRPFGVDLLAASPESLEESVDVIINGGADSFVAGLGVPMPIMERLKKANVKVMVVGGAVKHAIKAEQAGCDAVILQGGEGGGHTGLVGTLPLVAQAVEAVKIPVIAAGGIYDGRGLAASLALGAQGVWMGTRFIASEEAHAANMYKQAVVGAGDTDTTRTRCYSGKPMRCRTNDYINNWESRPQDIKPFPHQAIHSHQTGVIGGIGGITDEAKLNPDSSCFAMGQSAGGVHEVKPVAAIVEDIMRDAEASIDRIAGMKVKETA
ncbi:NAD(P)H-dependent flavin oxidoreductase [Hyphomonas jannaschiana]|uniref:Trans-2-enoyl-ACP reductase II n=1 Tax=Hyphomonas jannaschiana VP2 TaxID=1280952 RepID=A0A059FC52_9PROT|nr:nitronate monooxygenase [Hyphomonas jannaschiana]KCZ88088.1 trans-2-enoyl-ACP reductase II [Hyphomonas jannaschiana VP2]